MPSTRILRVQQMLASPAGCAFLLAVRDSGLPVAEACRPGRAVYLAAAALAAVDVWRAEYADVTAHVLTAGREQSDLAAALLAHPGSAWWFEPVRRTDQLWVSRGGAAPKEAAFIPPDPAGSWERYAQKPRTGCFTSTLVDGCSSAWAAMDSGTCDFDYEFPLTCWCLQADPAACVYEINGPCAWHELCVRYPVRADDGMLTPDWPAVAVDWDAVHLTLGGLLLAEQVEVASPAGWSAHWGWHAEQTVWLNWCFVDVEALGPRERRSPPPGVEAWLLSVAQMTGAVNAFPAGQRRLLRSIGRIT